MKIDFVVTWVDNNDPEWLNSKNSYLVEQSSMNKDNRYRDFGFFKYWFRSVEKYAPWVNKIFLITSGHLPEWLNLNNDKIIHIRHEDYIPKKYLPTFNSNVIELNIHRIKDLSENFVLFNDDVYLNAPVEPDDFFKDGLPRDFGIYSIVIPHREHSTIAFNNVRIINEHFYKKESLKKNWKKMIYPGYKLEGFRTFVTLPWRHITGYYNIHVTSSFLKSTFSEVWECEESLNETCLNKFRTKNDLNQWLIKHWQIEEGKFYPQKISFGKYYEINDINNIVNTLNKSKTKVICINDTSNMGINTEDYIYKIIYKFEEKFPKKSIFEI